MRGCIADANDTNLTDTLGHGKLDYSLCGAAVALRGWQSAALQDRGRSDVADVAAPARVVHMLSLLSPVTEKIY